MSTAAAEKKDVTVPPFGIRIDHHRNQDQAIQAIPNCVLRTTIRATRPIIDNKTGEEVIPHDQARSLSVLPEIPGMELHVNAKECSYKIVDPLSKDPDLCAKIPSRLRETMRNVTQGELRAVPVQEGTLDKDRMKTLLRELIWICESGDAKVVKGVLPDLETVQKLPGEFLLNPGARAPNMQPRYEKDFEKWVDNLARSGG